MNIFEKHFAMIEKNIEIFEQNKMKENIGISLSDDMQKKLMKSGKEILTIEKIQELMEVRSIYYNNVVMKKLIEYSLPEWFVCLEEKVLLDCAIPIFSKVLHVYPMLCGDKNEWQVLYEITQVNQKFWEMNKGWKEYFNNIIDGILLKYEQGVLELYISDEYVCRFKRFVKE